MYVRDSSAIHSPAGSRSTYSVRSGLMNMYSSHDRIELMPLPKSPAAARRSSGDGSSPATIGTFSRNQAVAGPPPWKLPRTNLISIASGANIGRYGGGRGVGGAPPGPPRGAPAAAGGGGGGG